MKKELPAPSPAGPDFARRPRRVSLERLFAMPGYGKLVIRPIRLDDVGAMERFHTGLPEESVYLRYFEYLGLDQRTRHERLARVCSNTADSYAVVIEQPATAHRPAAILAVGRLSKAAEPGLVAFDLLVASTRRVETLRRLLLMRLITLAHAFGFKTLTGDLLSADHDTLNLCRELGFHLETTIPDGTIEVSLDLQARPRK